MTIQYEIVTQKGEADRLILECWYMPNVVYPIINIVRIPHEPVKVDLGIMQCEIKDLVHVAKNDIRTRIITRYV